MSTKLNPKFKKAWIKALKSGEFTQATGNLVSRGTTGIGHCCIHVGYCVKKGYGPNHMNEILDTATAAHYIGLKPNETNMLVEANDRRKLNFRQIADLIKKNL